MEHSDLVSEMAQVEHLSTQDRLHLARMRRSQQLKIAKQKEKEWLKLQNRRDRNSNNNNIKIKRNITFEDSVVLLEAAARNDIAEVARLLQKGVTPDATNEDGLTALHQCCIDNNAEMLRLLLDYRADVNAEDSEKWTPLHAAATCGHLNLVKILISRSANLLAVNADGNMPYDLCDDEETLDFIEAEMSRSGVTQELIDETRASTESKMLIDIQKISDGGGDLDLPDFHNATLLHIASANGYTRVVEFLLDHHVSVDAVDNDYWTPVHAAACWGHLEVLEILAQNGADLNAKNKNDETPSDICEDPEIRERIEQLKNEQEIKKLAEAQKRRIRRSQSNTRTQSVRRTSLRDKTLTTKKDAVEETRLRMQAQEGYTTPESESNMKISSPEVTTTTIAQAVNTHQNQSLNNNLFVPNINSNNTNLNNNQLNNNNNNNNNNQINNNNNNYANNNQINNNNNNNNNNYANNNSNSNNTSNNNTRYVSKPQNPLYGQITAYPTGTLSSPAITTSGNVSLPITPSTIPNQQLTYYDASQSILNRCSPEGKDNESFLLDEKRVVSVPTNNTSPQKNGGGDISTEIFSNENGKINVQVTVLFDTQNIDHSIAGTLADLKKHRSQTRTNGSPENGSIVTSQSVNSSIGVNLQPQKLSVVSTSSSEPLQNPTVAMSKYSGYTGDVVSDSTRSRRCCIIM